MAKITREKIDSSVERNLIIGMIVSDDFIKRIQPILRVELLQAPFVRTIASWCKEYFEMFDGAPKKGIEGILTVKKEYLDDDVIDNIEYFLQSISDEYERKEFNSPFILKQTEDYLKKRSLEKHTEKIKALLLSGNVMEAEQVQASYTEVAIPTSAIVDVDSKETVMNTFAAEERDAIFTLPGALGDLLGDFCRGDFITIMAPAKRGKTFTMLDWGVRAYLKKLNVLFVSLEMTEPQINSRIYQNLCATYTQTKKEAEEGWNDKKEVTIPYFDEDGDIAVKQIEKKAMTETMVLKKMKALEKHKKGGKLRISTHPRLSCSVSDIKNIIKMDNINEGIIYDVVIVDYMDILKPEKGASKEKRHEISNIWEVFDGMCKEFNIVGISATQGSRGSFSRDMAQDDVPEDIRKLAHITRMVTINKGYVKGEDSENDAANIGVEAIAANKKHSFRFNKLVERFGFFDPEDYVRVLHSLDTGRPNIGSAWVKREEE